MRRCEIPEIGQIASATSMDSATNRHAVEHFYSIPIVD
jgi:hypothetical protein